MWNIQEIKQSSISRLKYDLEYLQTNDQITSAKIQEMCGFTKQQARSVIDKMRSEKLINLNGKGPAARYVIFDGLSDN